MQIGRVIYYDRLTGNVIQDTGERSGEVVETTQEQNFASYSSLFGRMPETVGSIKLSYGEYASDFASCKSYRVDISGAPKLVFSYPDPSNPDAPPIYQQPLSADVADLKQQNAEIILALVMNDLM